MSREQPGTDRFLKRSREPRRLRVAMPFPDFAAFSIWTNVGVFVGAAALIWVAGTRLANYADAISVRTQLSHAFVGMVLLGVATSLPEIATTITGALLGNARLVAGNLFGGVALQIAILAVVDVIAVRGALTYFTPQPALLFQGVMLLLLLGLALAGAAAGEPLSFAGVGVTTPLLMIGYLLTVRLSRGSDYLPRWRATNEPRQENSGNGATGDSFGHTSSTRLYLFSGLSALLILVAGWTLAQAGDALAEQTQLGASFVGVALVAASTSLPELSTSLGAVRRGNHAMAVSNILGTNCLEVALFLLADTVYRGGPILQALDRSALFAGAMGVVVTSLYLLGLLERRDRTVLGMGVDSLGVLSAYVIGVIVLYSLR